MENDERLEQVEEISLTDMWHRLGEEERVGAFISLSPEEAGKLFLALTPAEQIALIRQLPPQQASLWLRFLPPDDVADLLQELPGESRHEFENLLDESSLREVQALLAYSEDVAGGLMNPRFLRVRPDVTADVAIRYVRRQAQVNLATFYYIYVLDREQKLLGVVSVHMLFRAPPDALIKEIMKTDLVTAHENTDQETVAKLFKQNHLLAIPVVDDEERMFGLITVDDIVDVVQEEATEDIQKLGGTESLGTSYANVGLFELIKKRGGWLSVLFVGEMFTATAMSYYEDEIAKAVILAMFVPLIISSGGNCGSQASTLIVRALALEELRLQDWYRVFYKELVSGLCLGTWLGLIGFLRVVLWQDLGLFNYGEHYLSLGLTVCISLVGVVTLGTTAGSMLPFLLRRLGLDPATSSGPFVATLVDVTGLTIYFAVAALILSGKLL